MRYRVEVYDAGAHLFRVSCTFSGSGAGALRVSLPTWIPGSYLKRDFARHVLRFEALRGERPLPVEKVDNSTWQVEVEGEGEVTLRYEVYAFDRSVRAAYLDTRRGYFNGTSLFVCVEGREAEACEIELLPPATVDLQPWRVATTFEAVEVDEYGFGTYRAKDYDDLIDHPVEMGQFDECSFELEGVPHRMVFTGRHHGDLERIARDLEPICAVHARLFGGVAPIERYLFMTLVVGDGYGGLEHRDSTSLICSRSDLPLKGEEEIGDDYLTYLGLCSHEYFHTWNVKRIKPEAFLPYDLSREALTRQLWAFEGITSYYDDLAPVRSGIIDEARYLRLLAQTITRVVRGKGRHRQSVAESSFDAWTKFYRQDENAPNAIVSYYAKGALIALALDLTIRRETGGARSLDDLMRRLWKEYGEPGIGVPEGRIEEMAGEVAGCDLAPFFARYLHGTEDPPLAELLAEFGVELKMRPAESPADKGGKAATRSPEALARRADLGARTVEETGRLKIANVFEGSAAHAAGLAPGDELVALDGLKIVPARFERQLQAYRPGQSATLQLFRDDELLEFGITFQSPPVDTCELHLKEEIDDTTRRRRDAWLLWK